MDVFNDFPKYFDPRKPNNLACLQLRAKEREMRMRKGIAKRNDWFGFAAGLVMLFTTGVPLQMVWEFGLGEKIGNGALLFCCAGAALGLFFLTAPLRHRARQRTFDADIAAIEGQLVALHCGCAAEKLNGKSHQ